MNGKERVAAAMRGEKQDRIPVMCQLSTPHVIKHSRLSAAEFSRCYDRVYPETLFRLTDEYGMDGVLMDPPPLSLALPAKGKSIEDTALAELYFHREKLTAMSESLLRGYQTALRIMGSSLSVHSFVASPMTLLTGLYSIQDTHLALYDCPEKCKELLDELTEYAKIWADRMIEAGLHAVCVTAPYEGAGLISKEMYLEFADPYTRRLVQHITSKGVPCYIHMCGKINDRLEILADCGIDGLECLDPPPIGNVELADAIDRIGHKVFIKGNIDPVNTVLKGTPRQVYDDALRRLKLAAGKTNRFILSTACSVPADAPADNLRAIVRAAENYAL